MRTAVILLGLLALAAVPGSLLPQRGVASDPAGVITFYEQNPDLAPWLDRAGMFHVYSSPWFAAVYVLLLISMTGCVLPRCARLWWAAQAAPPRAPRNLGRFDGWRTWTTQQPPQDVLATAQSVLRRRGFRVVAERDQVRAERGYTRELGNLLFHLSLLVLLVGVAGGRLFGFEGRVAVAEGGSFANVRGEYDAFTPSVWTDIDGLEPLTFTLDKFDTRFALTGPRQGEPRQFDAALSYRAGDSDTVHRTVVRPNEPLDVNETKFFLTGHGYAPRVTVRDGNGDEVFSGAVIFLPKDSNFASDGVIKAPDASPTQLGFEGMFLPTAAVDPQRGPYSQFPDTLNPRLFLTAFTGSLGLEDGEPQSVFTLDKSDMRQVQGRDGQPFSRALDVGETMRLPDGQGSLTFDGVARFANFQVAYDPGKEISLVAAVMLLVGLTASLTIRRRRVWVRIRPGDAGAGHRVEVAAQSLTRRRTDQGDIDALLAALGERDPVNLAGPLQVKEP